MYRFVTTKRFEKDCRLMQKRQKDLEKLREIATLLCQEQTLPVRCRDHALSGNYAGRRECHIEPDWLLIYKIDLDTQEIIFERTGSHSDLF